MSVSKSFQKKVVDLIKLHILCCITFYRRADNFAKKDRSLNSNLFISSYT